MSEVEIALIFLMFEKYIFGLKNDKKLSVDCFPVIDWYSILHLFVRKKM